MRPRWVPGLFFLLLAGGGLAGESDREVIVARATEFLCIELETVGPEDPDCLDCNLAHPNLIVCDPTTSDIQWHADFLGGGFAHHSWSGMPYAFGSGWTPADDVQGAIDDCRSLGNHLCHYNGNGCGYPGCAWAVGTECTALVCYAGGVPRKGTYHMPEHGVGITWNDVKQASYLNKAGSHVVLVESRAGGTLTILEATGSYPVSRRVDRSLSNYSDYSPYDFKDVAAAEGSEGVLIASIAGAAVELAWTVDSASAVRWYEFQYWDPDARMWVTFDEQEFTGVGRYTSRHHGADAASLIYRIREHEQGGGRGVHCETMAHAARSGEASR